MEQYRDLFVQESGEQLVTLEQLLLRLERDPADNEAIHGAFRVLHTLKGMSGTLGLDKMAEVSHAAEGQLDLYRKGVRKLDRAGVDALLATRDWLDAARAAIAERREEPDPTALLAKLAALDAAPRAPRIAIRVTLADTCRAPAARAIAILAALSRWGQLLRSDPPIAAVPDDVRAIEAEVECPLAPEELRARVADMTDVASAEVAPSAPPPQQAPSAPQPAPPPQAPPPQVPTPTPAAHAAPTPAPAARPSPAPAPAQAQALPSSSHVQRASTIRVATSHLDTIVDAVGELVTNKARLIEISRAAEDRRLVEAIGRLDRLTTDLYENVLKARMVPLSSALGRFPRMVRDLAGELGKEVDLVVRGDDIELDRSVIDEVGDPLVHLLRNALDHGIESPEEREAAGKPRRATLAIEARREHNRVVVEVVEDGRGIDVERVRAKAVEKGLVSASDAAAMSPPEVLGLLGRPGFSTASKVTKTSGRGVGLDQVKAWVENLGGSMRISSEPGKGSRVGLVLPLTLAVLQALIVRVGSERYAVPIGTVEATVDLALSNVKTLHGREVFMWKDQVGPLVRLGRFLGTPHASGGAYAIVIEKHGRIAGLAVDDVVGQQEVVVKALDRTIVPNREFGGATILGDGEVALILNLAEIVP